MTILFLFSLFAFTPKLSAETENEEKELKEAKEEIEVERSEYKGKKLVKVKNGEYKAKYDYAVEMPSNEIGLRNIIGNEDWTSVSDITVHPYTAVAHVVGYFTVTGDEGTVTTFTTPGTGSFLDGDTVLTAAHCFLIEDEVLYYNGERYHIVDQMADYVKVYSDWNGSSGTQHSVHSRTYISTYRDYWDPSDDWGVITLNNNATGVSFLDLEIPDYGTYPVPLKAIGFPQVKGKVMYESEGTTTTTGNAEIFYHDCDTMKGNSGGPLINTDTGKLVGIHSTGSTYTNIARRVDSWLKSYLDTHHL